ncbi:TATA-binding protein-associated factor mot1 [Coemansia interrupta]|uniref:TATA-binding protein-associated factor mot1 n=1 Tax=Coemansia interrupta TaxID=1126814 RepID=A0A9W8HJG8_9FUNG|nr:TATA-binding protein-associated factor mot1 [Coemansia interrupta]
MYQHVYIALERLPDDCVEGEFSLKSNIGLLEFSNRRHLASRMSIWLDGNLDFYRQMKTLLDRLVNDNSQWPGVRMLSIKYGITKVDRKQPATVMDDWQATGGVEQCASIGATLVRSIPCVRHLELQNHSSRHVPHTLASVLVAEYGRHLEYLCCDGLQIHPSLVHFSSMLRHLDVDFSRVNMTYFPAVLCERLERLSLSGLPHRFSMSHFAHCDRQMDVVFERLRSLVLRYKKREDAGCIGEMGDGARYRVYSPMLQARHRMTTRLDRLVGLLDSGATPQVRATAARQIGGIQRQHPEELFGLLGRVYEHVSSKSWDTRVAAAQAVEAIAREVAEWDPNGPDAADTKPDAAALEEEDDGEQLEFSQFDVDSVIQHGRLLLGSAGREYDSDEAQLAGMDAAQRVAAQRQQMRKRLGLGAEFLGDDLVNDDDLRGAAKPAAKAEAEAARAAAASASGPAEIDMSKLSARERNRLKRKARMEGAAGDKQRRKQKKAEIGADAPAAAAAATTVAVTEQADAIVVEATRAPARETVFAISAGRWAFGGLASVLLVDLFDAAWETRHGAALALRALLKHQGGGGGRLRGLAAGDNQRRNQRFLEDAGVRLACVFALDRFGDFVGDHVVAPVRETCAQALAAASQWADAALVRRTQAALLQLAERGEARGAWEVRHAGLAALRYVVAVRRDLAAVLAPDAAAAALHALGGHDDDVRAVAAATLLPLVDALAAAQPQRLPRLVDAAVHALADAAADDLAACAAGVLALLAKLLAHGAVRDALAAEGSAAAVGHALVPRLCVFLRHVLVDVRRAALDTLAAAAAIALDAAGVWAAAAAHVFHNVVLETDDAVHAASCALWQRLAQDAGLAAALAGRADEMLAACSTPVGERMARLLLPPGATDAPMVAQDLGLVPRDRVVRCRVAAAVALGRLAAALPPPQRAAVFGPLLLPALQAPGALRQQLAAVVAETLAEAGDSNDDGDGDGDDGLRAQLRPALEQALARDAAFDDLRGAAARVAADSAHLAAAVTVPQTDASPADAVAAAQQLLAQTAALAKHDDVAPRRQRLAASVEYHAALQAQTELAVRAAHAGALVALGRLPAKLNHVMRALMAALKAEACALLQDRAAHAVARLLALCYGGAGRAAAADKLVRNLATLACADPLGTPVFAERAAQRESILMLELVQREAQADAGMAQAAAASAQASQRRRRRAAGADAGADAVPLVAPPLSDDQARAQAARLVVRGAEAALSAVAARFGDRLLADVPRLWACVAEPLERHYGAGFTDGEPVDRHFAMHADDTQAVVDALRVLQALCAAVPPLHAAVAADVAGRALPWVLRALVCGFSAVRHMAARALAALVGCATPQAMQAFVLTALPELRAAAQPHRRQGVAEAVYYVVRALADHELLPYVTFLVVPVLGRMSDSNEQTRLVCTNCFAHLIRLVPLEADIPDPPGLQPELLAKRHDERRFLAQLMDPTKLEPFRIPLPINATLRKYQQDGVDWLAFLNKYELHGVLCDDMGLGKTLQTICIVASDHHAMRTAAAAASAATPHVPSLVVCPPTLIGHWEHEIAHYTAGALRPLCYAGAPAERRPLLARIASGAYDVVVMSYDVVRNDIDLLAPLHWNYCVLDEGHVIKNARTKLTLAVKRLQARRRLILSGTPVQNNVIELWSLFDFLMPGFLGTERQFNEQYAKPILASRDAKLMSQQQQGGDAALKLLHKQVLPFLLRRMKEDVLHDLPPKIIQDYYCDLSDLQRFLYDEFAKSAVTDNLKRSLGFAQGTEHATPEDPAATDDDKKKDKKPAPHVFQALQYLRKLCNHPALVLSPKHPLYSHVTRDLAARGADLHSLDIAPKMQALKDLLNQCGIGLPEPLASEEDEEEASASHRVLIFCQHKEMIERIEQDLFARNMPNVTFMRVDGTVEARRRQEIVTRFNSDPSIDCLLLTTHVGGLGLNLTGADTVIFVEHDYNPAMDLQAMDRAHRLGQTRVVNVYRLITRGTLEEKIMGLQAFKLHMANTIVNQQNAGLASMNTDQLLDLFDVAPPASKQQQQQKDRAKEEDGGKPKSMAKAVEGLEELWDASQYEEYNLDNFISSLQQ